MTIELTVAIIQHNEWCTLRRDLTYASVLDIDCCESSIMIGRYRVENRKHAWQDGPCCRLWSGSKVHI